MGRTSQPQMGAPKPPTPATGVDVPSLNGGTPETPPLPRQGWMSPLRMGGGNPQIPHYRARGGCHLFEWGGPPTPAPVVDVTSSNGGGPPTPEPVVDVASSNGVGTPKPPHSRARGECRHFSCNFRYAKTLSTIFAHFAV